MLATAPLYPWEIPEEEWSRLHLDYTNPYKGHMFLVIVKISSQQQHTPSSVNQWESEATTWMGWSRRSKYTLNMRRFPVSIKNTFIHSYKLKVTGIKVSTLGRVRNCLDAHLGQIVCDKDGVVDWCMVLMEMILTRFEECWPLPTESLAELP